METSMGTGDSLALNAFGCWAIETLAKTNATIGTESHIDRRMGAAPS
jgi:hypothetical protein